MIRVLHLIVSLDRGGAEHSLLELVSSPMPEVEHAVCSIKPGGALRTEFERVLPGRLHSLGITKRVDWRALGRLVKLLLAERPAILHTWMFHANILGRIGGRLAGVPVVCSVRGLELNKPAWRVLLERVTNRLAAHTVAVSAAALERAIVRDHLRRDRSSIIPSGVPLPGQTAALDGLLAGRPVIGAVGRLETVKDHATLICAFAQVTASQPGVRLEIIGEGSQRPRLQALASELRVADACALRGEVPDAHNAMLGWDVFVQPSLSEGLPRAMLEAMAAGLPVVATAVGGIPEALDTAGILVPAQDPDAMAQAIIGLTRDPASARELGTKARQRAADEFPPQAFATKHLQLYRALASGRQAQLSDCH
jgi:glycosyltransferase involved in cell wall biosynthesis